MTIILGIDPGSRVTGYGVVQQQGRQLKYLGSGTIRTLATEHTAFPERLKHIFNGISTVIQQFNPDSMAIEQIFVAHNVDSALKLGHARGAAMVAAVNSNLTIFEYAARQIKQRITGQGSADKKQVQHMVRVLLHLSAIPPADAADALAVAITHCHSQNKVY